MANLGVPIKLLHESLGHIITVELKTGEVSYRYHPSPSLWRRDYEEDSADGMCRCTEES